MNALLDETATQRVDLGLPFLRQLRVSPTVYQLLSDAKPDDESWPDFATRAMVVLALLPDTIGLRVRALHRQCVRIVGPEPDGRQDAQGPDEARSDVWTGVRSPDARRECPYPKRQSELPGTLVEARPRRRAEAR